MLNCRHDLVAIILICCINVANKSPDVASSNKLNSDVVSRSWVCWVIYKSFWKKPVKRIRQVTLICSTWTVAWLPFFAIFLNMIRAPAFLILYGKKFTITNQFIFSRINVFLVWHWRRFALFIVKDTQREKAPSNKTPTLPKSMNMDIWMVDTPNQPFVRGF